MGVKRANAQEVARVISLRGHCLSHTPGYVRVTALHTSIDLSYQVIRAGDTLMIAKPERWFVLVLLALSVCVHGRPLAATTDGVTKKVAIVSFGVPSAAADRDWLGEGLPYVVALRLQHIAHLKVTLLPRSMFSNPEGILNVLDPSEVNRLVDRLQPLGYDALVFGHFIQVEPTLRAEIQVWTQQPERFIAKAQEQAAERDPDGLGIKLVTFVVSVLQVPPSDTEGRRFAERYTSSAEAFERFARALPLAEMADDEEDVTQAVNLFKEAVKFDGKFAMAWRQQGDLLFRQKQYAEAIEAYQAFLSVGRRNAVIYRRLGNAYFAQHDATRALDAYKRGLQLDGRDYQLHLDLGLAYAALRDYVNATKTLLRALEVKPDDALAFANLGVVYLLQGNFPAATASLRRAQLLQNSDPVLNYNLGLSLMYEKATDQAREQFERALQLKPNFPAAAYQLALVSERLNIPQALERWRSYLAMARGTPEEQDWVARAEEHLQRLQRP
jgi:tetratricopeptide (TPR) repeat protein